METPIIIAIISGVGSLILFFLSLFLTMRNKTDEETKKEFSKAIQDNREQLKEFIIDMRNEFRAFTLEIKEIKNAFNSTQISVAVITNNMDRILNDQKNLDNRINNLEKTVIKLPCLNNIGCELGEK